MGLSHKKLTHAMFRSKMVDVAGLQVRDEYRKDYDPGRGGWNKMISLKGKYGFCTLFMLLPFRVFVHFAFYQPQTRALAYDQMRLGVQRRSIMLNAPNPRDGALCSSFAPERVRGGRAEGRSPGVV